MNRIGIFMNFWVKNWDADHVKYIKKVSGLGFDILEFQAQALLEMDKSRMDEVRQAAKDNGIELTYSLGLNPKYDVASPDAKVREGGIEYLKRIVERIGYMEGKLLSGVNYAGWGSPDYIVDDKSEIVKHSIESVRQVIKTAEDYDVTYCVEVVNRFEGIVMNTAKEAIEYVKQIDSDKIGILLDTYHMNIEEGSIGAQILSDVLGSGFTGWIMWRPPHPSRRRLSQAWSGRVQRFSVIHQFVKKEDDFCPDGETARYIKDRRSSVRARIPVSERVL